MTREEAIKWLTNEKWKNANNKYKKEWNEAFDMAIEALSADAVATIQTGQTYGKSAYIKELVEVVRCKDCKHYRKVTKNYGICTERPNVITSQKADDFCSYGERREE